ncbi:predicted protein [Thalassiosira pseudonana CCMP1335]|uniref:riboflavin kinase n=1 Tax=Thalassiosira pseudonana TaxID=35128 RepID=B8C262_THAPS|nr:predicted protein [Thalassiosira pseudonana CCMP1335]EED92333.1 predicted protein [Thalassiosira pseudonana CCMP1335]
MSNSEDDEDEEQRGMKEAFASLDALSPTDLTASDNYGEQIASEAIKYSRTDDTSASNDGKVTKEEVEYYLEMQGELEGTLVSEDEPTSADDVVEDELLFDVLAEDDEAIEDGEESDDYPWESINPILRLRGPVATGYGRGGKQLGVPTANLPASLFQSALEDVATGVYFGWAVVEAPSTDSTIGRNTPIKAVVNVGYSPTFEGKENKEKIVEAHLITSNSPMEKNELADEYSTSSADDTKIEGDFYGETMRLQLIGFLRAERKFDSFPDLIAQIHRDIGNAAWALDSMPYIFSKEAEFIQDSGHWVGSGGGDDAASWEVEAW